MVKTEIKHFKAGELTVETSYGHTWSEVVKRYLTTGYKTEEKQHEVVVFGKTYKVLEKEQITTFYDNDGNTLFDVTNERLSAEYDYFFSDSASKNEETEDEAVTVPMGTTSLAAIVTGNVPKPADKDIAEAIEQMNENLSDEDNAVVIAEDNEGSAEETSDEDVTVEEKAQNSSVYIGVVGAVTKLQEELKKAKEEEFAEPIIEYLIERCKESESLAADICQDHKTWEKCYDYIYSQARKQAKGNSLAVRDDVVYEWAEDYYHKDDKAEEEAKRKEAAELKKKRAENMKKIKANQNKEPVVRKAEKPKEKVAEVKESVKSKKNSRDLEGQMDLFSMMGM